MPKIFDCDIDNEEAFDERAEKQEGNGHDMGNTRYFLECDISTCYFCS